jgi:SNF2 family DNA or RNA helicase
MAQNPSFIDKYLQDVSFDDEDTFIHSNPVVIDPYRYMYPSSVSSSSSLSLLNDYERKQKEIDLKIRWDSYKKIDQPKDLNIKLFPHQLVSVYDMEKLERCRKIKVSDNQFYVTDFGILGDVPGYGKSFSIITLVLRDKMHWDVSKKHTTTIVDSYGDTLKKITNNLTKKRVRPTLILASSNLIEQWKEYFSHVKVGKICIKEISVNRDMEELKINDYDVLLVNSTRYNDLMDKLGSNIVWKRFIFDDAASTPIPAMRHINAGFTWFVSATYQSLLNVRGMGYLKNFFRHFGYDTLGHLVIKNDDEFVKYSFKMPEVIEITHKCINPRILGILGNHVDSEVKLMISAGDIKGALARLGGGISNDKNIIEIVSKRHKEKLSHAKHSLDFWTSRGSEKDIEGWVKRVKEIEDNILELDKKYKEFLEEDCNICYSDIKDPIMLPCCQNIFCGNCVLEWLDNNKTCPMCRSVVNPKELLYVDKGGKNDNDVAIEKVEEKKEVLVNKHEKVLEITRTGLLHGKKFLVFSNFDESFNIIKRMFIDNDIDYIEISGSKASRDLKLKRFHSGQVNVVLLNTVYSGAGINMSEATDIIFYHEMTSHNREQSIGRALRIGREAALTIHNLIF